MEFTVTIPIGIALIIGLTEGIKRLKLFDVKYCFIASLALGIISGVVYFSEGDPKVGAWIGVGMGLAASGLFSGVKNFTEVKDEQ